MTTKQLKRTVLLLALFIVLYFEHMQLGPVKISQVWKIPIYAYFVYIVFSRTASKELPRYFLCSLFLFGNLIVNTSCFRGIAADLSEAMGAITLPLMLTYFLTSFRGRPDKVREITISLAIFYIVSNVPFIFGLLDTNGMAFNLERYGLVGQKGLTGLFWHPNITSKVLVISMLILLANSTFFKRGRWSKHAYWVCLAVGFYSIYACFVRSGVLLLIIGLYYIYVYKEEARSVVVRVVPVMLILITLGYLAVKDNSAIRMRIKGETTYRDNSDYDLNQISSNRLAIYACSVQNVLEAGPFAMCVGYGKKEALTRMERRFGKPFSSHNRYLELLQYGGLISVLLFVVMYASMYGEVARIRIRRGDHASKLPFVVFCVAVLATLPSHGLPIWADILVAGVLAEGVLRNNSESLIELQAWQHTASQ